MSPEHERPSPGPHRWVTAVFGGFLLAIAVVIALAVERPYSVGVVVCLAGLVLLGADAVISTARGRRSLLERIGPLP